MMKNVTGLDLVKLMAGSWGTLGVPDRGHLQGAAPRRARRDPRARAASTTPAPSRRCRWRSARPSRSRARRTCPASSTAAARARCIRIEGFSVSVDYRLGELKRLLKRFGAAEVLEGDAAAALWRSVRDVTIARRAARPGGLARLDRADARPGRRWRRSSRALDARWFYDWGGGLVWIATAAAATPAPPRSARPSRTIGGHATLVRAPAEVRAAVDVFEPLSEPLMRLTAGLKAAFDPAGMLNPGRMYAGV